MGRAVWFVIMFIVFVSCKSKNIKDENYVSVSVLPQKYFVEQIVKSDLKTNVMVLPGESPATYSPTPGQMKKLSESSLYLRIGHIGFEKSWISRMNNMYPDMEVTDLSKGCSLIRGEGHSHGNHFHEGGVDPHLWLSPNCVKTIADNIFNVMSDKYPSKHDIYDTNLSLFKSRIDSLDNYIKRKLKSVKRKKFLIFHPALTYFASDYGLEQIPIEFEGKNLSAKHVKSIIDIAKKDNINVVFIQRQFDRENAVVIANEIGAEIIEFDPLAENWLENMKSITDLLAKHLNKD